MTHPALHELQQNASALRRLARDLVGSGQADDVLQDAAVEVLRAPPREGAMGLATFAAVRRGEDLRVTFRRAMGVGPLGQPQLGLPIELGSVRADGQAPIVLRLPVR